MHIVDDEEAIRRSASFMLKTSGYAVETWASGVAFLKEIRHVSEGCILLDVRMPEMDGLTATRAIRSMTLSNQPLIIALTANAFESDRERSLAAGMNDFLSKPFLFEDIKAKLAEIWQT